MTLLMAWVSGSTRREEGERGNDRIGRRSFLERVLGFAVGIASVNLGMLAERLEGATFACGECFGCQCCEANPWHCENAYGACPTGGNCWSVGGTGICCDYVCEGEGFCCRYTHYE